VFCYKLERENKRNGKYYIKVRRTFLKISCDYVMFLKIIIIDFIAKEKSYNL